MINHLAGQVFWNTDGGGASGGAAGATGAGAAGGATGSGGAAGGAAGSRGGTGGGAGGGTGGGGSSAGGSGKPGLLALSGQTDAAGAGTDGGEKAKPAGYFPQGGDERFRGTNDQETIDKLLSEIGSKPKPPANAADYKLELDDKLKQRFGDMKDDKVLPIWRGLAHELNLSNEQFNRGITGLYEQMAEAGLVDDPVSVDKELAQLEPKSGDPKSRKAEATKRLNGAVNGVAALATRQVLSDAEAADLTSLAATATGVTTIEKLLKAIGERGVQVGDGGGASPSGDNVENINQLRKDPRYDLRGPKGDAKFVADVNARWRRLHGAA